MIDKLIAELTELKCETEGCHYSITFQKRAGQYCVYIQSKRFCNMSLKIALEKAIKHIKLNRKEITNNSYTLFITESKKKGE